MAYSCFSDVLRFLALVLRTLCLALLLAGCLLGTEQVAVWTLTTSPSTELNVNVWGPAPDLFVVVWWQDLQGDEHPARRRQRAGVDRCRRYHRLVPRGVGGGYAGPTAAKALTECTLCRLLRASVPRCTADVRGSLTTSHGERRGRRGTTARIVESETVAFVGGQRA